MARKETSIRPVLVFFDCPAKVIGKVGNNNDFTFVIHGRQPIVIRLSLWELGWAARDSLGDERYADFLRMIADSAAAKQGIDISEPDWHKGVCLLMLGGSFDPTDDPTKKLMVKLFPEAHRFKADQYGNIERIWAPRSRRAKSAEPAPGVLNFPIEELDLGVRTYNCLKRVGIETIGDLVTKPEDKLGMIPHFGKQCIVEVKEQLAVHGLKLADPS